jgi:predicted nucleic acid-binding protein
LIRVFLDANVLISAASIPDGVPRALFGVPRTRDDVTLLSTAYALGEAERNLTRKAPKSLDDFDTLTSYLEVCSEPPSRVIVQTERFVSYASDRHVLAGAVYAQADWFVTETRTTLGICTERRCTASSSCP